MRRPPVVDLHVHWIGEDPARGNYLSVVKKRSIIGRYLQHKLRLPPDRVIEEVYLERLLAHLHDPESPVTHLVLLGMDGVYDSDGTSRRDKTDMALSNAALMELGQRYPEIIPAISIHPYRRDAIAELERWVEAGARVMKWLPNSQDFDPGDPCIRPFLRRLAQLRLPVITHTGFEHTLKPWTQSYGDPERLRLGLEEGVRFIAAHSGSSGLLHRHEYFDAFLAMLGTYPHLVGDISAFTSPARFSYLKRLLDDGRYWDRLAHGSDYPIPPNPFLFVERYGLRQALKLARISNPLHRDLAIKRALGVPEAVFTNAARWLGLS